jgi:hypothetical protein
MTVTEFRKNLFRIMDRVVNGELVEVLHKGNTIRLAPPTATTKMSRLIQRDTLICNPDELDEARRGLQKEMRAEIERDWMEI